MERYEDSIEVVSIYEEQIMEYINDIHEPEDFEDGYEFYQRFLEIEQMIMNEELM